MNKAFNSTNSVGKLLYNTFLGTILTFLIINMVNGLLDVLGLSITSRFAAVLIGLVAVSLGAGLITYKTPRVMYGITIGYLYTWISLLLFQQESLISGLEHGSFLTVFLIFPLPAVIAGILGGATGKWLNKEN